MAQDPTYWTKWLVLSVAKYAQTSFGSEKLYIAGLTVEKNKPPQRYELRYLGPDLISQTQDMSTLHLVLNCQIATVRTPTNIEEHLIRVGRAHKFLAQCIPVYKYGSNTPTDDGSLLGHLQQISNVETAILGTVDVVSTVERSTAEAAYKITIEG